MPISERKYGQAKKVIDLYNAPEGRGIPDEDVDEAIRIRKTFEAEQKDEKPDIRFERAELPTLEEQRLDPKELARKKLESMGAKRREETLTGAASFYKGAMGGLGMSPKQRRRLKELQKKHPKTGFVAEKIMPWVTPAGLTKGATKMAAKGVGKGAQFLSSLFGKVPESFAKRTVGRVAKKIKKPAIVAAESALAEAPVSIAEEGIDIRERSKEAAIGGAAASLLLSIFGKGFKNFGKKITIRNINPSKAQMLDPKFDIETIYKEGLDGPFSEGFTKLQGKLMDLGKRLDAVLVRSKGTVNTQAQVDEVMDDVINDPSLVLEYGKDFLKTARDDLTNRMQDAMEAVSPGQVEIPLKNAYEMAQVFGAIGSKLFHPSVTEKMVTLEARIANRLYKSLRSKVDEVAGAEAPDISEITQRMSKLMAVKKVMMDAMAAEGKAPPLSFDQAIALATGGKFAIPYVAGKGLIKSPTVAEGTFRVGKAVEALEKKPGARKALAETIEPAIDPAIRAAEFLGKETEDVLESVKDKDPRSPREKTTILE